MTDDDLRLLAAELIRDEGVESSIYLDSMGIPTIGVGHNLTASPLPAGWVPPLTDDQINELLAEDIQTKSIDPLNLNVPWWNTLDSVRQRIFANMVFNMGIGAFLQFKNMLAAVESENYAGAAAEMKNSAWYSQVGDRAVRLCAAMQTGIMPQEPSGELNASQS